MNLCKTVKHKNCTNLYTTLQHFYNILQISTQLYNKSFTKLDKLYKTLQSLRNLYTTFQNSTQLYITLQKSTTLYTVLHNFTNLDNTQHNSTTLFKQIYNFLHNLTKNKLDNTLNTCTLHNFTALYTHSHNFTTLVPKHKTPKTTKLYKFLQKLLQRTYTTLQKFTNIYKTLFFSKKLH